MDFIFSKEALGTQLESLDVVLLVGPGLGREGSGCCGPRRATTLSTHTFVVVYLRPRQRDLRLLVEVTTGTVGPVRQWEVLGGLETGQGQKAS